MKRNETRSLLAALMPALPRPRPAVCDREVVGDDLFVALPFSSKVRHEFIRPGADPHDDNVFVRDHAYDLRLAGPVGP